MSELLGRKYIAALLIGATMTIQSGCVSNQLHNPHPSQYLREIAAATEDSIGVDLAIIEFDDFGMLWDRNQLDEALALIRRRNQESDRGIMVVTYTHGWMNDADPTREQNDLTRFRTSMEALGGELRREGAAASDRVVGVYLGWRGATDRIPGVSNLSFWSRKDAAERVASYQMREALLRLTEAAKERQGSKVLLSGHSMGGMILAKTLAPTLATLLLAAEGRGVYLPSDLVLLQNPALDGLSAFQLIEFLKRIGARVELRHGDGRVESAAGPAIVSITSEADWVTRVAYPAGQILDNMTRAFRSDLGEGIPSQGKLANRAHGHMDFLVSHRALIVDGELVVQAVPGAFNDTPFWIIQVPEEICRDHGDIYNDRFLNLVEHLTELNRVYEPDIETWMVQDRPGRSTSAEMRRSMQEVTER